MEVPTQEEIDDPLFKEKEATELLCKLNFFPNPIYRKIKSLNRMLSPRGTRKRLRFRRGRR
jgi:hypothetical protein